MATLTYSQIRVSPGSTIHYITNKDKMISFKVHDVTNVLSYMGEEESCTSGIALNSKRSSITTNASRNSTAAIGTSNTCSI